MGYADMQSVADVVALDEARQKRFEAVDPSLLTAGGMLGAAREAMGLSVEDLAARTNIKSSHISAIEAMNIKALPAQPYTMGFVRAFAREVALPETALMDRFRVQAGYQVDDRAPSLARLHGQGSPESGRELSVLLIFAVVGFALWCAWQLLVANAPVTGEDANRFTYSAVDLDDTGVATRVITSPDTPEDLLAPIADVREIGAEPALQELPLGQGTVDAPAAEAAVSAVEDTNTVQAEASSEPTAAVVADNAVPEAEAETVEAVLPRVTVQVEPVYPPLCEGQAEPVETVTVAYGISSRGRVTSPRVIRSTNACFDGAALAALTRWRFDPETVPENGARGEVSRLIFERPY